MSGLKPEPVPSGALLLSYQLPVDDAAVLITLPARRIHYPHLRTVINGWSTVSDTGVFCRINDLAATEYDYVSILGTGSGVSSDQNFAGFEAYIGGIGGGAPQGGHLEIDFPNANRTGPNGRRHFTSRSHRFTGDASGQGHVRVTGARFDRGDAITSLRFGTYSGSFSAGTVFEVYGTGRTR